MNRGFWFAAGAGAGAYAVVRARRMAEAFTADGLADRWHALSLGARLFRDEVAQGQAEAEFDLRERFGLVPHGVPELVGSGTGNHQSTGTITNRTGTRTAPPIERHQDEEGPS